MAVRYISVTPVANLSKPATRAFGNVAIIGAVDSDATGPANTPIPVTNPDEVMHASHLGADGTPLVGPIDSATWFSGPLGDSVRTAFTQTPGPSLVYALRQGSTLGDAFTEAGKLDAQIIVLAGTPLTEANSGSLTSLADHVVTTSNTGGDGKERIGVVMFAKDVASPPTDTEETDLLTGSLVNERIVVIAHKSDEDAAAAVAGTIAGYEPHVSLLLKPVSLDMPTAFSSAEIDALDQARVNWLIDPPLIPGRGLYMGEAYTQGAEKPYLDIVRTIDDLSFRLKANLISSIGSLRVSRSGLRTLASRMTAVLQPRLEAGVIEAYDVFIPLLVLLDKDPATLTDAEVTQINTAQNTRQVSTIVSVDYAGAIHRLNITLKFE